VKKKGGPNGAGHQKKGENHEGRGKKGNRGRVVGGDLRGLKILEVKGFCRLPECQPGRQEGKEGGGYPSKGSFLTSPDQKKTF